MLNHGIDSHESYPQHSEMSHYLNHGSSRNCEASKLHEIYGLSQELERYEKLHHTHLLLSINFTVINLIIGKAQPSFEKRVLHISQQKRFFLQVSCTVHEIHKYHIQQLFFVKLGLIVLFTHLKIILLQYFQFSVISGIKIDPQYFI